MWKYIWPKDMKLQLNMLMVAALLLVERALKVLVPLQLGAVTNALGRSDGELPFSC